MLFGSLGQLEIYLICAFHLSFNLLQSFLFLRDQLLSGLNVLFDVFCMLLGIITHFGQLFLGWSICFMFYYIVKLLDMLLMTLECLLRLLHIGFYLL